LHSICIHNGNANTGHYYSFIFDRNQKKWWKYSDLKVEPVEEEDVMTLAMGSEKSWESAYWLTYINPSIATL
jgi:ubiquitin carboxyl-terminal hydrolase 25/28